MGIAGPIARTWWPGSAIQRVQAPLDPNNLGPGLFQRLPDDARKRLGLAHIAGFVHRHDDFGDALRSLCNRAGEEAENLSDVVFDLDFCDAFVHGYTVYAKDFLTQPDRKYLYDSIRLITFELGIRFFQDHLAGNVYFNIRAPEQNLHRASVQFRLCESIEIRKRQIKQLLDEAFQ